MKEDELQKLVETGNVDYNNPEAKAYKRVFDSLGRETSFSLPSSFANRVMNVLLAREKRKEIRRDYFWLALGIFGFVIAFAVVFVITDFKFTSGVFSFLSSYGGLIIFGIAFVAILNFLEKKIRTTHS